MQENIQQNTKEKTTRLSLSERIEKAKAKEKLEKERRQKLEAILRTKEKKNMTRSQILMGAYIINKIIKNPTLLESEKENILAYIDNEDDKELIQQRFIKITEKIEENKTKLVN